MTQKLLIKNALVIDPENKIKGKKDILLEDGKITAIKSKILSPRSEIIDAKGMLIMPGLIDMHCHLRDPGRLDKEDIGSGTRAAALGGFTSICCMANTNPCADNAAVIKYIKEKAAKEGVVNVFPVGAASKELKGEVLTEMALMIEQGAVAFSDDGKPIMQAAMMRKAIEYAKQFNKIIISHCEDPSLAAGGSMNEGKVSTEIGLPGIPALSEEIMVGRDVLLAKEFGALHIAHVSSGQSVETIRRAKQKKTPITCETCPHYFTLTQEAVREYDPNTKVNPPLKTQKDLKAIIKGLQDGTIDVIATDHAPHNIEEKNVEFNAAAFGMVGLETALGLVLTKLVNTKLLKINDAIYKMTLAPARILGLDKGTLRIGADADLIIVDPDLEWTVDPAQFASKSRNSPFKGMTLKGKVCYTIVGGKIVVGDGKLIE